MDVLWYDDEQGLHFKAVVRSPVLLAAQRAAALPGDLLVTGTEMGGGPVSRVLRRRAAEARVVMSASAAATIHHDPERVRTDGIRIVTDESARAMQDDPRFAHLELADIEPRRITAILDGFGVPSPVDVVAVCGQDHGAAPPGVSHLDYRHNLFTDLLEENPVPEVLLFEQGKIPATFNRLRGMAAGAAALGADRVYAMDSGMAAILGAGLDRDARGRSPVLVLDVATSHTVLAVLAAGKIDALVEYHTRDVTLPRLESLIRDLPEGRLHHRQVLAEGGHGAYTRQAPGFESLKCIVATGPRRRLVASSKLPIRFGAPLGDNMMTGCAGLLAAVRRREGAAPPEDF
jgi:uncharacterized protein (DUF1786 family)